MERLRPYPVAAFCALTLFIWTNRIWLAWTNDTDTVARKVVWSIPITFFEVAAIVLAIALLTGADRTARWFTLLVRAFAIGTIAYWGIRLPMILLADHEVPFEVVHSVLALVSITAAAFALRSVPVASADDVAPTRSVDVPVA